MTVNHDVAGSSPAGGAKKSKSFDLDFFICVRRTQLHLTEGQHHFEQSENIIPHLCGHKTMLRQAANDVTARAVNDVMLRINDVGLRPMLLRSVQIMSCICLRIDYTQHFVLILYRRQAADFIHAKA